MNSHKKSTCNIFNIKSQFIHQQIGTFIPKLPLLRIAKHSKQLQHLMDLTKEDYEIYSLQFTSEEKLISFQTTTYQRSIRTIKAITEYSHSSILNTDHAKLNLPISVFSLTQISNGKIIVGSETSIYIINPKTMEIEQEIEMKCQGAIIHLIDLNDNTLLCGSFIRCLKIIDLNTEQILNEITGSNPLLLKDNKLAYTWEAKEIRIISTNSYLELTSIEIDKIHRAEDESEVEVIGSMIQLSNSDILIASWNLAISQYDIPTKMCVKKIRTDIEFIHYMFPLKDERVVLTSVDVAHIFILDLLNPSHILTLKGHNKTVNDVIQLSDETLVSVSDDAKIKFWKKKDKIFECSLTIFIFNDYIRKLIKTLDESLFAISDEKVLRKIGLKNYLDDIYIKYIPRLTNNEEDNTIKPSDVFEIYHIEYTY